jgi:ParB/RepB/Spo0J family partition protein
MTMAKRDVLEDELDDLLDGVDPEETDDAVVADDHCEICGEYEGECTCEDAGDESDEADDAPPDRHRGADERILEIALEDIAPDPEQARDEGADDSIGDALEPSDVLPPIEVRTHPNPSTDYPPYMIIDGERRWRGSKKAGRTHIRAWVNVDPGDDGDRLLRQAVLNEGQRLKPMEEARTWARIRAAKCWNLQQLADAVRRPKSTVSDRLALLDAPAPFQPLFAKGILTAAAAPIVREFRDVPERILREVVEECKTSDWGEQIDNGVPVPVEQVRSSLDYFLTGEWGTERKLRPIDKKLGTEYTGATCTIKGKKYAIDVEAYDEIATAAAVTERSADTSAPRQEPKWMIEQREKQRKERIAHEKKRVLHRAQYDVIAAKLPTKLDADWSLFVIAQLVKEIQQDDLRVVCKVLNLEPPKKGKFGGLNFDRAILDYAVSLDDGPPRVKLALQVLLARDLNVSMYMLGGPERLAEAAKLLKIDLSKIKPTADEKAKAPAKPSTKKKRS